VLFRSEGGGLVAEAPGRLGPVLVLVIDEIDRRSDVAERLAVTIPPDGGPLSDLDPDAFAVLARNLIENALKHGDPEGTVSVRLTEVALEVENDGPVIAADRLDRLTRRFERGPTRAEGSGLGLAIAAAICRGSGATLDLVSPAPGRADGFLARVRLPSARSSS
jgi:two-component system OmpR family sensor kinase